MIGVLGASACGDEQYAFAESIGAATARAGAAVVCGGKTGVMEVVCRGAKAAWPVRDHSGDVERSAAEDG